MTDLYYLIPIGMLVGTNVAAMVGWRKAQKARDVARDDAAYERWVRGGAERQRDQLYAKATDAEDRLRKIERQRSETTRRGNITRAAKRRALVAAKTAEIAGVPAEPIREAA